MRWIGAIAVLLLGLPAYGWIGDGWTGFGWAEREPTPVIAPVLADISDILIVDPANICRARPDPPTVAASKSQQNDPLPVQIDVTDAFRLIDHEGQIRTRANLFEGKFSIVFFGYASCEGVCSLAIPAIAEAAKLLRDEGHSVQPVMVTIDPERDTPAFMQARLHAFDKSYIGLTGPEPALANARRMFNVRANPAFEDAGGTVFQHGSFVYLMNGEVENVSLLPPVMAPEQMAAIAKKYL